MGVSGTACSGTEVVVRMRMTCSCGIHKEFSFEHRPWSTSFPIHLYHQFIPIHHQFIHLHHQFRPVVRSIRLLHFFL